MARTKPPASASAKGQGARSSNPPRTAASKRKNYFEQDAESDPIDEEDGDTKLVNEEEEEDEEDGPSPSLELANLVNAFTKSRVKKEEAERSKTEKQLAEKLQNGQAEVDSLIEAESAKNATLIDDLHLHDVRPYSRIEPKGYRSAFSEQHTLTTQVVAGLNAQQALLEPENDEIFDAVKQSLHARPHAAKRALKKLTKSTHAVIDERRAMAELHQGAAQEAYRHLKALARL
ncbi:hypothetical protein JCM10207_004036 [Rhodosporidiobolus poonsookiae]